MEKKNIYALSAQVIPIFIVIVIAIASLYRFNGQNALIVEENNSTYLKEIARQKTEQVDMVFKDDLNSIQSYAYLYGKTLKSEEVDLGLLKELEDSTGFDYIRFIDREGNNYATDGKEKDCSDRNYYIEGIKGNSGITSVVASRVNGQTMVGFYAPVHYNHEIIGVLVGFLSTERMSRELASYFYEYTGITFICDPERNIIASSQENAVGNNIFELFQKQMQDQVVAEQLKEIQSEMKEGKGPVEIAFQGDYANTVAYTYFLEQEGWMLIQTFPSAVNQQISAAYGNSGVRMMVTLIVTFILYIVWLLFYFGMSWGKASRAMKADSAEQMQMIQVLCENYNNVYCINRKDGSIRAYREGDDLPLELTEAVRNSENVEEAVQIYMDSCVCEEEKEKFRREMDLETICKNLQLHKSYSFNYRAERYGDQLFFNARFVRIGEADDFERIIVGFSNVDKEMQEEIEQKQLLENALARAEKANQTKTIFLANMSHDIRTPMNAILGFSNIALKHIEDKERVKDSMEKIISSGNHLLELIDDILDMSRIESGKIVMQEEESNLSEIVHDVVGSMLPQMRAKKLQFEVETNDIVNERIYVDKLKLRRILVNLLRNALKYTPSGKSVLLKIRQKKNGITGFGHYEFIIKDTGIGMDKASQEKIFEPFERADTSSQDEKEDSGLGMTITKNMVDMMGGHIEVHSKPGEGTEFVIDLEFRLCEDDIQLADNVFKGMNALVIDDEMDSIESVIFLLEQLGMKVDWSTSPKEAIVRSEKAISHGEPYDVYLIDLRMPGTNGIELTKEIRAAVGDEVPVVILSAYDWLDEEEEAKKAGVTMFCSKPLFKTDLLRAIQKSKHQEKEEEQVGEPDTKALEEKTEEVSIPKNKDSRHILLVEDIEMNQLVATEVLQEMGHTVEVASDGTDAVEMVANSEPGTYDIVFMDIMMPVLDGYQATKQIRALDRPDAKTLPIVAMTANALEDDRRKALESGMNDHISKPFKVQEIQRVLREYTH